MATELIPAGSAAATSADFTLEASDEATIALAGLVGGYPPVVTIELKDPAGGYTFVSQVDSGPQTIFGAGAYRVRRLSGTCSVYRG